MYVSLQEFPNKVDAQNTDTKFSKDLKDYRILAEKMTVDEIKEDIYSEELEEFKNRDLYIITADREILMNDWYYWLGYLILDKNNNIIDGICFN